MMVKLFLAGGWLMYPLLGCSIVALTIIGERLWTLREEKIIPTQLVQQVLKNLTQRQKAPLRLVELGEASPLGHILASGLEQGEQGITIMRARMEDQGRQVIAELERYLSTLGTIASSAPLLGLLGTVLGMIQIFTQLGGQSDHNLIASGIAQALLTTAFGLFIAIPSLMFYRYFRRKIEEFALKLEREAQKLLDGLKKLSQQELRLEKA